MVTRTPNGREEPSRAAPANPARSARTLALVIALVALLFGAQAARWVIGDRAYLAWIVSR